MFVTKVWNSHLRIKVYPYLECGFQQSLIYKWGKIKIKN